MQRPLPQTEAKPRQSPKKWEAYLRAVFERIIQPQGGKDGGREWYR